MDLREDFHKTRRQPLQDQRFLCNRTNYNHRFTMSYMDTTNLDFIGDIHGHAAHLVKLLEKLGYAKKGDTYIHPNRKIVFVGDFIDRGPDNPRVIEIVRPMVENGAAYAVLGNHEANAIQFSTLTSEGYVRPHSIKNFKQHSETLLQFQNRQSDFDEMICWFKTLPLFIENDLVRVVHASWDSSAINQLKQETTNGIINDWSITVNMANPLTQAMETTCKGVETELPDGVTFKDKDGTVRRKIRIKWWQTPDGKSIREMNVEELAHRPDDSFPPGSFEPYPKTEKPVFFGHYWMQGQPTLQRPNVCCLDFSVAKNGLLTAYRWDGESVLSNDKFFYV